MTWNDEKADRAAVLIAARMVTALAAEGQPEAQAKLSAIVTSMLEDVAAHRATLTDDENERVRGFLDVGRLRENEPPILWLALQLEAGAVSARGWTRDATSETQDRLLVVASSFMLAGARLLRLVDALY